MSEMFNVLLIGSGGREYAFLRKLLESPDVKVTVAPGLSGMLYFHNEEQRSRVTLLPAVKATDIKAIVSLAKESKPDLTVVGPEDPLILGLADELKEAGFKVFGFSKIAAQLEGSKDFCKRVYSKLTLPTSPAVCFTNAETAIESLSWFRQIGQPVVLKCDNPALGKCVIVVPLNHPDYWQELKSKIKLMFD
jgi:phosphoribosylamine--glycine ligase